MSDIPKLKPCPFCGGDPQWGTLRNGAHYVECLNEDCLVNPEGVFSGSKVQCANEWNTRAEPKVKPLVWEQMSKCVWRAETYLGYFVEVKHSTKSGCYYVTSQILNYENGLDCDTLDGAMSLGRADYEKRIFLALGHIS